MNELKIGAFFLAYSLVISYFLHYFFLKRATTYLIKKANTTAERWSSQSKPILGGITFFVMFIFAIVNFGIIFGFDGLMKPQILGTIIVVTIGFMMGLADDMLNTPPGFKFVMQLVCAVVLIFSGITINLFGAAWINNLLTIFWVVGIMNSLNMLDNMDAITTSVSAIVVIATIVMLLFLHPACNAMLFLLLGTLAAFLSFLAFNWHPSKMYMGDNGSQFIGAFLAITTILYFWNYPALAEKSAFDVFTMVYLLFLIPITDTSTVTINRLMRKQSPFVGGRDHTTHHLSYAGLKDNQIAMVLLSINALSAGVAIYLAFNHQNTSTMAKIFTTVALLISATLYTITKVTKPKKK